eukprot:SAG31_NODE_1521_length_8022_cov_17.832261_3_plen_174_part_00
MSDYIDYIIQLYYSISILIYREYSARLLRAFQNFSASRAQRLLTTAAGSGQPRPCRKPITTATTSSGVSGISWAWSAPAARRSWTVGYFKKWRASRRPGLGRLDLASLLDAVLGRLLIDSKPCIFLKKVPCKIMILTSTGCPCVLVGFTSTVKEKPLSRCAQNKRVLLQQIYF